MVARLGNVIFRFCTILAALVVVAFLITGMSLYREGENHAIVATTILALIYGGGIFGIGAAVRYVLRG